MSGSGAGNSNGTVTFINRTTTLRLATLSGGVATLTVSTTPAVRTYSITAAYIASVVSNN